MSVKFIGYIGFNNGSETQAAVRSRALDTEYVDAAAKAQEDGGFDRVLIPFGSNSPESQIIAAHAAARTTRLGFLVAHRPASPSPPWRRASWRRSTSFQAAVSRSTSSPAAPMTRWPATATRRR